MARTYHICVRARNRVEYTGPGNGAAFGPGAILCVMWMMVIMVMLMVIHVVVGVVDILVTTMGCERRAGKHHQEQCDGEYFPHAKNVPPERLRR
jgi:uncharacterized membrane protein